MVDSEEELVDLTEEPPPPPPKKAKKTKPKPTDFAAFLQESKKALAKRRVGLPSPGDLTKTDREVIDDLFRGRDNQKRKIQGLDKTEATKMEYWAQTIWHMARMMNLYEEPQMYKIAEAFTNIHARTGSFTGTDQERKAYAQRIPELVDRMRDLAKDYIPGPPPDKPKKKRVPPPPPEEAEYAEDEGFEGDDEAADEEAQESEEDQFDQFFHDPVNYEAIPDVEDEQIGIPDEADFAHEVRDMPPAHLGTQRAAWDMFYLTHRTGLMNHAIKNDIEKQFVRFNTLTGQIEPIVRHAVSFRRKRRIGGRARTFYIEAHELKPHPLARRQDETDIHAVSKLVDPLHGVLGTPSRLGSYIQIKVLPNILNICIKKGVQLRALQLLAKRLLNQNKENFTHILIKRLRNGRYIFKSLYTNQQLQKETAESLGKAFMKLIKGRKYIHLMAKPNMNMYNSFEEKHLLG